MCNIRNGIKCQEEDCENYGLISKDVYMYIKQSNASKKERTFLRLFQGFPLLLERMKAPPYRGYKITLIGIQYKDSEICRTDQILLSL